MMDRAGKHFSSSGCSHNAAFQVSHPSRLTLGCHLNSWCVKATPRPCKSVQTFPTITQTRDGTTETGGGTRVKMMLIVPIRKQPFVFSVVRIAQSARVAYLHRR